MAQGPCFPRVAWQPSVTTRSNGTACSARAASASLSAFASHLLGEIRTALRSPSAGGGESSERVIGYKDRMPSKQSQQARCLPFFRVARSLCIPQLVAVNVEADRKPL